MKDELWVVLVFAFCVLALFGIIYAIDYNAAMARERDCLQMRDVTGYNTKVMYDKCYVQISEQTWARSDKLVYYLNMIDCK